MCTYKHHGMSMLQHFYFCTLNQCALSSFTHSVTEPTLSWTTLRYKVYFTSIAAVWGCQMEVRGCSWMFLNLSSSYKQYITRGNVQSKIWALKTRVAPNAAVEYVREDVRMCLQDEWSLVGLWSLQEGSKFKIKDGPTAWQHQQRSRTALGHTGFGWKRR